MTTKDFDPKTGSHPSIRVEIPKLNEEEMARRTLEDLANLPVHDSGSGADKSKLSKAGLMQEQKPSKAKVPTTATGEKL
jgi:hypothetical protein